MRRIVFKPEYLQGKYNFEEWEFIEEEDIGLFDERHMATHGMNRNLQRDIPLFFDNLKVVQRRLLYTMARMGLFPSKDPNKNMTKATGVVGETLKTLHPHGDQAAWKALVFMRQPWRHLVPLVDIKGNYGNAKNPDNHAQMRYVNCRLSEFARDCFFDSEEWDLKSDLVDKRISFNGKDIEPLYLPAKYPLFLMSWGSGIGHGLSTSSPGFLPQDAMNAIINLIDDPDADIVLYPEDPSGCTILDKKVFKKFVDYKPGKNDQNLTFRVRSTYTVSKDTIIVHNTPFEVNPTTVEKRIVDLVNSGKLDGIADIEVHMRPGPIPQLSGDGDTPHIRIYIKKGFDPHIIMEKLYKATQLETTFPLNCVYVMMDRNVKFNLREAILHWIEFRRRILKRMFRLRLNESSKRIYVLDALIMLFKKNSIDDVIKIIKGSSKSKALETLIKKYSISDYQAEKILDMRIRDLSPESYKGYVEEREELLKKIEEIQNILKKKKNIDKIIKRQMEEGIQKYSRKRLSKVINLNDKSVDNTIHTLTVTDSTFVKKLSADETDTGNIAEESKIIYMNKNVPNTAKLFMFTPTGRVFSEFVHKISNSSKEGIGMYVRRKVGNDSISFVAAVADTENTKASLVFVTRKGIVKQTKMDAYFASAQNSMAVRLAGDDSLVDVIRTDTDKDKVLLYTKKGNVMLFDAKDITLTSRTTVGVMGIRLEDGDEVIGACSVRPNDTYVITISDRGEFKKISLETSLTSMRRGDLGVSVMAKSEDLNTIIPINDKVKTLELVTPAGYQEVDIDELTVKTRVSNGDKLINALRGNKVIVI